MRDGMRCTVPWLAVDLRMRFSLVPFTKSTFKSKSSEKVLQGKNYDAGMGLVVVEGQDVGRQRRPLSVGMYFTGELSEV